MGSWLLTSLHLHILLLSQNLWEKGYVQFFCSVAKRPMVLELHYCQCKEQQWGFLQPHLNGAGVCQVL